MNVHVARGGKSSGGPVVCAAHTSETFSEATAELLGGVARAEVVCISAPGRPFEEMVDAFEAERQRLGLKPWVFWGMSGGGFLAQLYAHRHPEALAGMVVESCCACMKARVSDPACVLSPRFPAWTEPLRAAGLLGDDPGTGPTRWMDLPGVGQVFRREGGPALVVSPGPVDDAMRASMPSLLAFDARPWLPSVRTPALVIAGSEDPVVPVSHVKAVHEALGDGSTFLLVKGGGHVPSTQRASDVPDAYRVFLARHRLHTPA